MTEIWDNPMCSYRSRGDLREESSYIMDAFETQRHKRWFQQETFLSLMRLRGMECIAPSGYAEAFYCRKLVL